MVRPEVLYLIEIRVGKNHFWHEVAPHGVFRIGVYLRLVPNNKIKNVIIKFLIASLDINSTRHTSNKYFLEEPHIYTH